MMACLVSLEQTDWTSGSADIGMSGGTDERGTFSYRVSLMVVYTVKQSLDGHWSVRRMGSVLFGELQLAAAIRLARTIARDEHDRSRRSVSVEMHDATSVIRLGSYQQETARSATA
jgi:hypothetical protein